MYIPTYIKYLHTFCTIVYMCIYYTYTKYIPLLIFNLRFI